MRRTPLAKFVYAPAAVFAAGLLALTACGGGSSDTVGSGNADSSGGKLKLFAYAVPKPGFDKALEAFNVTDKGRGVALEPAYGPSSEQSRKVADGAEADLVSFSLEPDITRLVDKGKVDANWNADANKGIPFGSVVVIAVRKGNPKNIRTWDDLLKPGINVVTPNPFSSGSAKWNLLAPYAAKSDGGRNPQAGLDYLDKLIKDHIKVQPKSGSEATETFLQGTGDVLLSYENEAITIERKNSAVEHIVPAVTFKIENPIAVVKNARNLDKAVAFRDFLYTKEGQQAWVRAGFRPVDPQVVAEFAKDFPQPAEKLWSIADFGGWKKVDAELFTPKTGKIAAIYEAATK